MPISMDEFKTIDASGGSLLDLSSDTTQGKVYRFLLENADQAFRQQELIEALDVPRGSVGPTLSRLERHGLVEHRDRFWAISDAEHASVSAGLHGAATAADLDGGFTDEDVELWMETAVDPIEPSSGGDEDEG